MSGRFSEEQRERIRRGLGLHMRAFGLSPEKLAYEMIDALGLSYDGIDRRTLERFLKKEKRTGDATVALYHQFVESLPEPDPVFELGDAIAEFFSLPTDFAERRSHIARMQERYAGEFDVFDITEETHPDEPAAKLRLTSVPHSPFLIARDEVIRETGDDPPRRYRTYFDGLAVPREQELFILLKEFVTGDERIYLLRSVAADEAPGWAALSAFFGNVIEKKAAWARERNPAANPSEFRRILLQNRDPARHTPPEDEPDAEEDSDVVELEVGDVADEEDAPYVHAELINDDETGHSDTASDPAAVPDEDGTKRSK